jgi:hypothetical protein
MDSAHAAAWQAVLISPTTVRHAPWAPGGAIRILVVDGDWAAAEQLAGALHSHGHHVRCARRAAEALVVAEELQPHLVVIETGAAPKHGCPTSVLLRCRPWAERLVLFGHSRTGQVPHRELLHYEFPGAIEVEELMRIYEERIRGVRYSAAVYVTAEA